MDPRERKLQPNRWGLLLSVSHAGRAEAADQLLHHQHTLRDWHTGTKPASPLFSRREDRQGTLRMCMPGRQCGCGQRHLNLLTDPDVGEVSCGR